MQPDTMGHLCEQGHLSRARSYLNQSSHGTFVHAHTFMSAQPPPQLSAQGPTCVLWRDCSLRIMNTTV